jgi:hypothetical protein
VIRNRNQPASHVTASGTTEEWIRNGWRREGHCNRCDNGLFHTYRRRGAGGEHPSGVSLAAGDPARIPHIWEDEVAPGEKRVMRRQVRARGREIVRRIIREEVA